MISRANKYLWFLSARHRRALLWDYTHPLSWVQNIHEIMMPHQWNISVDINSNPFSYHPCWARQQGMPVQDYPHWQTGYFRMSYGVGISKALFYFLHELTHFYQDTQGLFDPYFSAQQEFQLLCLEDEQDLLLFCEQMASYYALAMAYCLYDKHHAPVAWQGALSCDEWRDLAYYYQDLQKLPVSERQSLFIKAWHKGTYVSFYQKQASAQFLHKQSLYPDISYASQGTIHSRINTIIWQHEF